MTAPKIKLKESYVLIASVFVIVFILTISSISVYVITRFENNAGEARRQKVLGTSKENNEKSYWVGFLAKNPYYYPGWRRLNEISYETHDIDLQNITNSELVKLKPIEE